MDVLRLINGMTLPAMALGREAGVRSHHPPGRVNASGSRAAAGSGDAMETAAGSVSAKQSYMSPLRPRRLWPSGGRGPVPEKEREDAIVEEKEDGTGAEREGDVVVEEVAVERRRESWVVKILRVGSMWTEREAEGEVMTEGDLESAADAGDRCVGCACGEASEECVVGDDEEEAKTVFDQESFSRLLRKVSLREAQFYAKMSYLGGLAYVIPKIKTCNLLKSYGLRFVTSSVEKKSNSLNSKEEQVPSQEEVKVESDLNDHEKITQRVNGISASSAHQAVASAASYMQSPAKDILPLGSSKMETNNYSNKESVEEKGFRIPSPEETSFMATTSSVTAVVAGKEEMKKAVVKDLNSANSSPCEWYICDDDKTTTRYFVIQGSETLASWQANLLFEPIQFEGLDVLVHRGIYEAAKGIYLQMLPEIKSHLREHGESATLRFTGHSLGGSLALLVNLMLLIRGEAPAASLMPVITFGAPSIMCGGDYLLQKLGLPKSHVEAITLHRDIVPRAFSCHYPDHVAKILKAVNGNFRNHPCLVNQKFLYAPMGKLLILQPEDKYSPPHHLLPPGSGLYILGHQVADSDVSSRLLSEAQSAFLNSPHPLEILSDPSAYGSEGTVYRDHDMNSYLRAVRGVIHQEFQLKREQRHNIWSPLVATQDVDTVTLIAPDTRTTKSNQHQFSFSGVLHEGRETFRRIKRLVTSHHMHMFVVLLFPARVLLLGAFSVVNLI